MTIFNPQKKGFKKCFKFKGRIRIWTGLTGTVRFGSGINKIDNTDKNESTLEISGKGLKTFLATPLMKRRIMYFPHGL